MQGSREVRLPDAEGDDVLAGAREAVDLCEHDEGVLGAEVLRAPGELQHGFTPEKGHILPLSSRMLINCVAYQDGKKLAEIPVEDISVYVSRPDCFVWVAL